MSRYIDADAMIADMQERYCKPCKEKGEDYHEVRCRACWVDDAINDVDGFADNSIDIEPKRGEWILHPDDLFPAESTMECSICHEHEFFSLCNENFCPNCGADMRGKDDE